MEDKIQLGGHPLILRILATMGLAATLLVNWLANYLPINNKTTGEVSDLYPSLFTPAGVTFSIWAVIYFLLSGFVIFIWMHRNDRTIISLLPLFIATCLLNSTWIIVWHHLMPGLSVLVMLLLLVTLIRIFLLIQRKVVRRKSNILLIIFPFSIYLAWICVATIANISAWLTSLSWNAFHVSTELWTMLMMIAATSIGLKIFIKHQAPEFIAVIAWALLGIFLRWNGSDFKIVQYGSLLLMAVLLASMVYLLTRPGKVT